MRMAGTLIYEPVDSNRCRSESQMMGLWDHVISSLEPETSSRKWTKYALQPTATVAVPTRYSSIKSHPASKIAPLRVLSPLQTHERALTDDPRAQLPQRRVPVGDRSAIMTFLFWNVYLRGAYVYVYALPLIGMSEASSA
jgi:hypothetical protein